MSLRCLGLQFEALDECRDGKVVRRLNAMNAAILDNLEANPVNLSQGSPLDVLQH